MSDGPADAGDDLAAEGTPGYVAPAKVGLDELKNKDADDEALNRWKAQLLAGTEGADANAPKVQMVSMALVPDGHEPLNLDLTGDLSNLEKDKDKQFTVKEGIEYHIEFKFKINNEIVTGLKYVHAVYRKGVRVSKDQHMLGSYGPKAEPQAAKSPKDEFPKGMIARGTYVVKSKFTDDDGVDHLSWKWTMHVKKDWA